MNSRQDIEAFVAWNPTFKRQPDIKTFLDPSLITKRHPQTTPSFPQRQRNRVTVYHCNGMDIFEEKITDQFSRWTFAFPATAQLIAGWAAMNYGSALAPTGTIQQEIQTIAKAGADITSGTFGITHTFEGRTGSLTLIPWNISGANLKKLLESGELPTIEEGDIASVVGTNVNSGYVVTLSSTGKLKNSDVSAFVIDSTNLVGGTGLTVTETQKGGAKYHAIARSVSPVLPQTSFIIGFEDDPTPPLEHGGFICDALTVEAQNRQDLTCTVELIGSAKTREVLDYVIPACVQVNPINTSDCRLRLDGGYVTDLLGSVRWERRNNVPVGNEAFPWDGKDIALLWRGRNPTESFGAGIYGSRGDDVYDWADRELKKPMILDLGTPGDRVSFIAPNTSLKLGSPDINFDGELRRSLINVVGTPHFADSINASSRVEAYLSQTEQFLTLP